MTSWHKLRNWPSSARLTVRPAPGGGLQSTMRPLIECVPNISEGRDQSTIDAVVAGTRGPGVAVLDVDSGRAANRTVITLAGSPVGVAQAALRCIATATRLIDMRTQRGVHPRIGAADVCPFVPLAGISVAECVAIARGLGRWVATHLNVPVYLYAAASTTADRRSLIDVRRGQYEGLRYRMQQSAGRPDFGQEFNERAGAVAVGVRPLLVAYNVHLDTRDARLARRIAARVRRVSTVQGQPRVRATGWYIDEYQCAQVTCNVLDVQSTPLHLVYRWVKEAAQSCAAEVNGSEIVGLVPERALRACGRRFGENSDSEQELLDGIVALGLDRLAPFEVEERVLERRLAAVGLLPAGTTL